MARRPQRKRSRHEHELSAAALELDLSGSLQVSAAACGWHVEMRATGADFSVCRQGSITCIVRAQQCVQAVAGEGNVGLDTRQLR